MKTWVEKHRPQKFEEVICQEEAIEKIKNYFFSYPNVKRKAILLNGPPGIGKTTLAHVLAKETNSEIFELNASDLRNKLSMESKLTPAIEQSSLFNKNKIILIDEVDGISGTEDKGGLSELIFLIEKSKFPIICTSNDIYKKQLSDLKKKCEIIELKKISPSAVKEILKKILKEEKKEINLNVLNKIAINSRGDLRSAINDLETTAILENFEEIEIDSRNKKEDIFNAIKIIFQEKATDEMIYTFDKVDMGIDEIVLWIEENISKVYSGIELFKAYERLSKVDIFKKRIYKQQYWRFLVYENIFLSYGISEAKGKNEKKGFYQYKKPDRILKIWLNNQKHSKKKSIAEKFSQKTHVGYKRIIKEWNEIKLFLKNPLIQKELKLDEDEINYLMKY